MNKTQVLIVDDHPMMRTALRITLEDQPELTVVGEAGNLMDAREKMLSLHPELILLDLYLPDGSGVELIHFRNEKLPEARILVVTSSNNENDIIAAIEAGASSYVVKDAPTEQLLLAVKAVLTGENFLTAGATGILLKHIRYPVPDELETDVSLSEREEQILRQLAKGDANPEIALRLKITESTLRTHLQRILKKLGLKNHNQLVIYAAKNYL